MTTTHQAGCARGHGRAILVASALRLIGSHGLHAMRLCDVAADAGLSLGSTTYHFADRAELVRAALARHVHLTVTDCTDFLTGEFVAPLGVTRARELLTEFASFYSDPARVWMEHELHIEAARTRDPHMVYQRDRSIAARSALLSTAYSLVVSGRDNPHTAQWIANRALAFADGIALRHTGTEGLPELITWHLESFFNYQSPAQMSDPFAAAPTPAAYWAHHGTDRTVTEESA